MKMKTTFLALLAFLCASTNLSAQKVYVDKTTDEGRVILTKESKYYGAGRDDEISLNYFSHGDDELFQLHIDFDESDKQIRDGYKMLLKHDSGKIMELTCLSGEQKSNTRLVPFAWIYDTTTFQDANYLLTREQIEAIISDPVIKMRVEYHQGYLDVTLKNIGGSKLSSFIEKAYKEINTALSTRKTGLYDGF